jgi:hypothetical protein
VFFLFHLVLLFLWQMTGEPREGYSKTNTSASDMVEKEEKGILHTNMEFVDGWTLARTLGEGAFGE